MYVKEVCVCVRERSVCVCVCVRGVYVGVEGSMCECVCLLTGLCSLQQTDLLKQAGLQCCVRGERRTGRALMWKRK